MATRHAARCGHYGALAYGAVTSGPQRHPSRRPQV